MKKPHYFNLKKNLIYRLTIIKYWLEKNIDKEDTLNKLYYIILIYINIDKKDTNTQINATNKPNVNVSKYAMKVEKRNEEAKLEARLIEKKNIINDLNKTIDAFFTNKNNINNISNILYDNNINYFDIIKEKKDLYFNRFDLEIKFLPNFLQYDSKIILMWICFCLVIDKKKTTHSTYFLHDIYLFQNEKNNISKTSILITILDKITNYIQFFDYEKK